MLGELITLIVMLTTLTSFLVAISFGTTSEGSAVSSGECARTPAAARRLTPNHRDMPWLAGATRLLEAAHPSLRLRYEGDSLYVYDNRTAYDVRLHYDHDEQSGYAALIFVYNSQHDAALLAGQQMTGQGCRSQTELVIARLRPTGSPEILARGALDPEASTVDVRTMTVDADDGEPAVSFFHYAYYGAPGWWGNVVWRSSVGIKRGQLFTQRLPASYAKYTPGKQWMQGYLAPAGADRARQTLRLLTMAFGTKGEVEQEFEIPVVSGWGISGMDILRLAP